MSPLVRCWKAWHSVQHWPKPDLSCRATHLACFCSMIMLYDYAMLASAGPLAAVVRAQAAAASSTVSFINSVGFYENRTAITLNFTYATINSTSGRRQMNVITVPQLAIVPIPFIRVRWACNGCVVA